MSDYSMLKVLSLTVVLAFFSTPGIGQFFLNGDAKQFNDSCYQLTDEGLFKVGSIWNPEKIDLSQSFEVLIKLYFGCNNADGADGIVFGFQPVSTSIGVPGEGIGFAGVQPSIGIEFDTWQNTNLNDPPYDHIAIISSGNNNHGSFSNLAGPVQASPSNANIEDCRYHDVRVSWDATEKKLEVAFDCVERVSYSGDIVADYLQGDPLVYWGFTSATGGSANVHRVCFSYTSFLDKQPDVIMCPGGQVQLLVKGGISYKWTPTIGLNNPNIPNPIASPSQSTTYLAEINDDCGFTFYNEVKVEIAGDSVFFDLGPDTSFCVGDTFQLDATTPTAIYSWSNGSDQAILPAIYPGLYEVTVTRTDTFCTAIDWVTLSMISPPSVNLGQDVQICLSDTMTLSLPLIAADYEWSTGDTTSSILVTKEGTYGVIARNNCGLDKDQIKVSMVDCDAIFFPNAFSPNDDGINDTWFPIIANSSDLIIEEIYIFDRWGNLLLSLKNILPNGHNPGWDGRWKGQKLPPATYVWLAYTKNNRGERFKKSGSLTLTR